MSATSESSALFKFLFIFETPYLNISGMLSMPLFISLFPIEEFRALEPISIPSFARFPPSPFPDCLHFFLFFLKLDPPNLTEFFCYFFLVLFFPIFFLVRVTLIFLGSCFQLILSYLATKVFPFGRFTTFGVALFLNTILSFIFSFFYDLC